ncbi:DUF6894 family protein [Methylobacterium phyllosphaerae]
MPVFFFDVCARGRHEADEDGLELASAEASYLEARFAIPGLTAEFLRAGDHPRGYTFLVADEADRVVFEIPFQEILDREPRRGAPGRKAAHHLDARPFADRPRSPDEGMDRLAMPDQVDVRR